MMTVFYYTHRCWISHRVLMQQCGFDLYIEIKFIPERQEILVVHSCLRDPSGYTGPRQPGFAADLWKLGEKALCTYSGNSGDQREADVLKKESMRDCLPQGYRTGLLCEVSSTQVYPPLAPHPHQSPEISVFGSNEVRQLAHDSCWWLGRGWFR